MIHKVVIRDNTKSPIPYLSDLPAFKNGMVYEFKPGVNVIVGENGCGKTTLMKLIERYCMVDKRECDTGMFNSNIRNLFGWTEDFLDGVDVYGDYQRNIFRLCHMAEKSSDDALRNADAFSEHFTQLHSSTGEGVVVAMQSMFKYMFSKKAKLTFDYEKIGESYPAYGEYVKAHRVEGDEFTLLMDEPDRNLDIENISGIKGVLSFHKEMTQVIAVVHNPLLICYLSKRDINMIEMTEGYVDNVKKMVKELVR